MKTSDPAEISPFTRRLKLGYERSLGFNFFGLSENHDFWNFGYWHPETKDHAEACESLMEELLALIPQKRGRILDVGCGKGGTTRHLLKYFKPKNTFGINISEKQLEVCRAVAPGCTFAQMDATRLDFPDRSFDYVICVEAAVHFDTREKFLSEAHRVLKPGGRHVLSDVLMSFWAPSQPRANYLSGLDDYRRICWRAGFAEASIVDATEACWGGLSENVFSRLTQDLQSGRTGWPSFNRGMNWLRRTESFVQHYILGECKKDQK